MAFRRLAIASLALVAATVHAGDLGVASGFNAVVFGNFNPTSWTDSEGRLAVGGNYDTGNLSYTVNGSNVGGGYGLITGGYTSSFSNTVNGGIFSNGNLTWADPSVNGNVVSNGNINFAGSGGSINGTITLQKGSTYTAPAYFPSATYSNTAAAVPFDFAGAKKTYEALSTSLGKLATTGKITDDYNNLLLTGNSAGLNVFNVSASEFSTAGDFQLDITKPGATAVVNIYGSPTVNFLDHGYELSGISGSNVLYNFVGVSTVIWNGAGVNGSLLMPDANLVDPVGQVAYGNINGQLIANNYSVGLQLNLQPFQGNLPKAAAVPEPSSIAALGFGALAFLRRRKNS